MVTTKTTPIKQELTAEEYQAQLAKYRKALSGTKLLPEPDQSRKTSPFNARDNQFMADIHSTTRGALFSKEEEKAIFIKRDKLVKKSNETKDKTQTKKLQAEVVAINNLIISHNLRLVPSIAKRYSWKEGVFNTDLFENLIPIGNDALFRAVDGFDVGKGNKFSTYATWAIIRSCNRECLKQRTQAQRFTSGSEMKDKAAANLEAPDASLEKAESIGKLMELLYKILDTRSVDIIKRRFGISPYPKDQTLQEVAKEYGLSKERIRQIEKDALDKLSEAMDVEGLSK